MRASNLDEQPLPKSFRIFCEDGRDEGPNARRGGEVGRPYPPPTPFLFVDVGSKVPRRRRLLALLVGDRARRRIDTSRGQFAVTSCSAAASFEAGGRMILTMRILGTNSHASSEPFRSMPWRVRRRFIRLSQPTQTGQNTAIWRYPQYPQGSCLCYRSAIPGE
jgi:hypothetical protein